ncbi:hypothetical protein RGUI_2755 [Rhodovulum sp. P5]|uniref:hemolysin XhlA family protein n=1 Tax=Rhodovulum sp. P5 TaxID=1564506 RepID=UPI0009C3B4E5|nr:hemolysin XhlA family protein [Rhodovulum sp. P5]ARE40896.1 hypothetical protein RGUI_2755 [Rhodovulum sp. P5]
MTEIDQHPHGIAQAHRRLDAHEQRIASLETMAAVATERDRQIREDLGTIKGGIKWLMVLVLGGLGAAAVDFILSGGLAHVAP